jgi:hypothetical protein
MFREERPLCQFEPCRQDPTEASSCYQARQLQRIPSKVFKPKKQISIKKVRENFLLHVAFQSSLAKRYIAQPTRASLHRPYVLGRQPWSASLEAWTGPIGLLPSFNVSPASV